MSYWKEKMGAAGVICSWLREQEKVLNIPEEIMVAVNKLQVRGTRNADTSERVLRPGYNCTLLGYFQAVEEKLKAAGGYLSWGDIRVLFNASSILFVKRYDLFCKRYPEEGKRLILAFTYGDTENGVSLKEERPCVMD